MMYLRAKAIVTGENSILLYLSQMLDESITLNGEYKNGG